MRQHNSGTDDGRQCWRTARERERLRARFHIRERVANEDKTTQRTDETIQHGISVFSDPPSITILQNYITYIKSGDRSKFSLSQLDRHFDLVSSRIPRSLLETTRSGDVLSLQDHSLQLCTAWFGVDYSRDLELYMDSLATFTLMEYAGWMGKFSIVGALLLAGVNPCTSGGRLKQQYREGEDWSVAMGARINKRFFDCFPLLLSTYIVKRVVELRRDVWVHQQNELIDRNCDCCERRIVDESLLFRWCHHHICEACFWNDLLEHIDRRGDSKDVVVCPSCGRGDDDSSKEDLMLRDSEEFKMNMPPREKGQRSLVKFEALPVDRQALKASCGKKKKKPTERDQWAPSWNDAVLPSLGSTQSVRQDKFFSFVERNSFHFVRGCLYAGVEVDWTNEYGQTALYICAWRGYDETARLLLEFGANPNIAANDGSSPFGVAVLLRHESVQELMEEYGCIIDESKSFPSRSNIFPTDSSWEIPGVVSTLIPPATEHPGAGSYTVDEALSTIQIEWLLSLHGRIPVNTTQKKKAGLCSQRSYFCDSSEQINRSLQGAIVNAGLVSERAHVQVFAHMRFLDYSIAGTTLNPHVDICRADPISGRRSTHTFILYLTDCLQGGETSLLGDVSGERRSQILACVSPKQGRLLLFPHACPHEGNEVRDVPKILLRGEVFLAETGCVI